MFFFFIYFCCWFNSYQTLQVRLRHQASLCGFDKYPKRTKQILTDLMIMDVIVEGCTSVELRRRMLLKDRTLDEIEDIASSLEGVDSQIQDFAKPIDLSSGVEKAFKVREKPSKKIVRPYPYSVKPGHRRQNNRFSSVVCFNCGKSGHISTSEICPARGRQCRNCNRVGHFESKCKSSNATMRPESSSKAPPSTRFRRVEQQDTNDTTADKVYYAFFSGNSTNVLRFDVGGVQLEMLVDSGADANLVTVEASLGANEAIGSSGFKFCKRCRSYIFVVW